MNIRKVYLGIITLLYLHATYSFSSTPTSQKPISHPAKVEALFLPQAQEKIFKHLSSFLETAQNKILIAMYWLTTDKEVIDLLLQAKKRNVDIQIILDKSSPKTTDLITKFLAYKIIPLISLRPKEQGKMHNKFIVIDDKFVWTGSANFTPTVLNPEIHVHNDENIIRIESPAIAKQYSDEFQRLEKSIIESYMQYINFIPISSLPYWFPSLCINLFETNNVFREKIFKALIDPQNIQLQERIYTIIPTLKMQPEDPQASQEAAAAQQPGRSEYSSQPTMSESQERKEMVELINRFSRKIDEDEKATSRQKEILESFQFDTNISRKKAEEIIKNLFAIPQSPSTHKRTQPTTPMGRFAPEESEIIEDEQRETSKRARRDWQYQYETTTPANRMERFVPGSRSNTRTKKLPRKKFGGLVIMPPENKQ